MKDYKFRDSYKKEVKGFSHISELYTEESGTLSVGRRTYVNRTWEAYTFEKSRKIAVLNYIVQVKIELLNTYKKENVLSRLSKKIKEEIFAGSEDLKELNTLYQRL